MKSELLNVVTAGSLLEKQLAPNLYRLYKSYDDRPVNLFIDKIDLETLNKFEAQEVYITITKSIKLISALKIILKEIYGNYRNIKSSDLYKYYLIETTNISPKFIRL